MENTIKDIERLEKEFMTCRKILTALGDETRLHLICVMLKGPCGGNRVIDIAKSTNLSRPAVSHHIQILKNAGLVKMRKEGTCIYYYLDPSANEINNLITLFSDIQKIVENAPDRSGENF